MDSGEYDLSMKNNFKVIYIAGNGHSGSTLLDIILGSQEGCFSAGELNFITRKTIFEEYCSCKRKISECDLWQKIFSVWLKNSNISYEEYKNIQWKYERNKGTLNLLKNYFFPSKDFYNYCQSTRELLKAIQKNTNSKIIIDSSKNPQRILVLRKIVNLKLIKLHRNFIGVLNSAKRFSPKNIEEGVEEDLYPTKTSIVVRNWLFTNIMLEIFSIGLDKNRIKFNEYRKNLETLNKIDYSFNFTSQNSAESFSTPHMLAGNKLRLKKNILINPSIGSNYSRLNKKQKLFAKIIDRIFWFWS